MNDSPLKLTLREMHRAFGSRRIWALFGAAIMLLTISGPFQTLHSLSFFPRFAYWSTLLIFLFIPIAFATTWIAHSMHRRQTSLYLQFATCAVTSGVSAFGIIIVINKITFPLSPGISSTYLFLFLSVLTISCVLTALSVLTDISGVWGKWSRKKGSARTATEAKANVETPPVSARLFVRLEGSKRGDLISLGVHDHYVDVTTSNGKSSLLMRFADAINETDDINGVQIHRSHWVALDQVKSVRKHKGRVIIEMNNGEELPVSRTYMAAAKASGLLG